jgi:hypothetical protein
LWILLQPETSNEKTVLYRREEKEMAANCPPQMASVEDDDQSATTEVGGSGDISTVVLERLGQIVCAMHGHDNLIQFEHHRMFLKCASCGHETPGWTLPNRRPVARVSDVRRREPAAPVVAAIDDVKRVA